MIKQAALTSLFLLFLLQMPVQAEIRTFSVELPGSSEIPVQHFPATGDRILWLPSEFGLREAGEDIAGSLAQLGMEVWRVDLHGAYFIAPGHSSLAGIPVKEIAGLIQEAQKDGKRLFIFAAGRGAALSLAAVKQWQIAYPQHRALGGLLLLHPNLLVQTPEPGQEAEYLPIAKSSNVPVFVIQPKNSARHWYLPGLLKHLEEGGSSVFSYTVADASDGYHVRAHRSEKEKELAKQLPTLLKRGMDLLSAYNHKPRQPPGQETVLQWQTQVREPDLHPYRGNSVAPPLVFDDLGGGRHDLGTYQGEVVLINFWATWCPPCVKELPSLGRLQARFQDRAFRVLSVNVGEPLDTIQAFLNKVPVTFPVLPDPKGISVTTWKVRAFPTTFLLDRQGQIRYGYFGALEWDAPNITEKVVMLLEEP